MQLSKELLDRINAAVEADQILFKQAANDLGLTLNEGAISGRMQGYFKGMADEISRSQLLVEALEYLIEDIKRKPNDTRYATAIKKATEALKQHTEPKTDK